MISTASPSLLPPAPKRCFDPVYDQRTRILMLGSLPGDKSLSVKQYYGNRQNRFWLLLSEVIGADLVALDYASRLEMLRGHGIGLWDVVAQAHRIGSLDSNIRTALGNDLPGLIARLPALELIAFNGGTASRHGIKALAEHAARYKVMSLPSSSPAYTIAYAEKLAAWLKLRQFCLL